MTVRLEGEARAAEKLEVDASVDDGPAKVIGPFARKAGDLEPSIEISFPGYGQIRTLAIEVRAYVAGRAAPIAAATETKGPLPAGCLTLTMTLSGAFDGGGMDASTDAVTEVPSDTPTDAILLPIVVRGSIGTIGERPPAEATMRIRDDGLEFFERVCSGAVCVKGGILP